MKECWHIVVKIVLILSAIHITANSLYASQSTITESEGYACMGDDKSRKQTEQAAVADAKRRAAEKALTYIQSETHVKDWELEKDLLSAYMSAQVKILQEGNKGWYNEASIGDCYKIAIKAEVIPDTNAIEKIAKGATDTPSSPLNVQIWTDKKEYKHHDKIKVYLKGNKPFYARVVYKDASGSIIQLLPNPYRTDNYFNGGVIYELPSGNDKYDLEVSPPFGEENLIVYAGTSQLGDLNLKATGGVYQISTKAKDIGDKTRSITIKEKASGGSDASEFFEENSTVRTGK